MHKGRNPYARVREEPGSSSSPTSVYSCPWCRSKPLNDPRHLFAVERAKCGGCSRKTGIGGA